MKILCFTHNYPPAIGGTEVLIQNINSLLKNNYNDEIKIITSNAVNCEAYTDKNIKPLNYKDRFNYNIKLNILLKKLSLRFDNNILNFLSKGPVSLKLFYKIFSYINYDIIFTAPFPTLNILYAYLAKKIHNIPLVIMGLFHFDDKEQYNNPLYFKIIKDCDLYIAMTEYEKKNLINKNIPENKIKVLNLGIQTNSIKPDLNSINLFKKKYNIMNNDKIILFLGQKIEHKGILTLIDNMKEVWKKSPSVKLILAGSSNSKFYKNILKNKIKQFPNIIDLNNISESLKHILYYVSDIFISMSKFESLGLTFLEAWSYKKPVITSDIPVLKELITDNYNGLIAKNDNLSVKILELLNNKEKRKKLGENGFNKLSEQFNITKNIRILRNELINCCIPK